MFHQGRMWPLVFNSQKKKDRIILSASWGICGRPSLWNNIHVVATPSASVLQPCLACWKKAKQNPETDKVGNSDRKVSVDELQSKKYLETNWKVRAYQILWKGHDCSNMEFWKHVQLPQPSDGCSFPHGGNPDWSWDSATALSNREEGHGQALGCATHLLHGLCVISGSVAVSL